MASGELILSGPTLGAETTTGPPEREVRETTAVSRDPAGPGAARETDFVPGRRAGFPPGEADLVLADRGLPEEAEVRPAV
jgi:hypothetical protein